MVNKDGEGMAEELLPPFADGGGYGMELTDVCGSMLKARTKCFTEES